jgi:hypothetical protein
MLSDRSLFAAIGTEGLLGEENFAARAALAPQNVRFPVLSLQSQYGWIE